MSAREDTRAAPPSGAGGSPAFLVLRDVLGAAAPDRHPTVDGVRTVSLVDRGAGAVHLSLHLTELDPGATIPAHGHAQEESVVLLDGEVELWLDGAWHRLEPQCFALAPFARPHAWRNTGRGVARWFTVRAPSHVVPAEPAMLQLNMPDLVLGDEVRAVGQVVPWGPTVGRMTPDDHPPFGPLSLGGLGHYGSHIRRISVLMAADRYRGAVHHTLLSVRMPPGDLGGAPTMVAHAHPFEEAYLVLKGETSWELAGIEHAAGPGDLLWTAAGTTHAVTSASPRPTHFLEVQAPAPPDQHGFVFPAEWKERAAGSPGTRPGPRVL